MYDIIRQSCFRHIFQYMGIGSYHRMFSWIWVLTFGYITSHIVKTNHLHRIEQYNQTAFTFIYDYITMLSYSVCLYYMSGLNKEIQPYFEIDSLLYMIPFTISVIGFMVLGEITWMDRVYLEWNFWNGLDINAIVFLVISAIAMCMIVAREIYIQRNRRQPRNVCFPLSVLTLTYTSSWFIVTNVTNTSVVLHLHHAFVAALFSFWFITWDNTISFICHALCIGVWVEGINAFGTDELKIFIMDKNPGSPPDFYSSVIIISIFCGIMLLSSLFNHYIN